MAQAKFFKVSYKSTFEHRQLDNNATDIVVYTQRLDTLVKYVKIGLIEITQMRVLTDVELLEFKQQRTVQIEMLKTPF